MSFPSRAKEREREKKSKRTDRVVIRRIFLLQITELTSPPDWCSLFFRPLPLVDNLTCDSCTTVPHMRVRVRQMNTMTGCERAASARNDPTSSRLRHRLPSDRLRRQLKPRMRAAARCLRCTSSINIRHGVEIPGPLSKLCLFRIRICFCEIYHVCDSC